MLTEPAPDTVPLDVWLTWQRPQRRSRQLVRVRRNVLRDTGALLARLHEASCYLPATKTNCPFAVRMVAAGQPHVVLDGVEDVQPLRRACRRFARRDVDEMMQLLTTAGCKPAGLQRFLAGYHRIPSPIRIPVPVGAPAEDRRGV